jgi:hypothetical protein
MIRGEVPRQRSTETGTPGAMALENGFSCDTLELGWHDNERGRSCTKADTYRGKVWYSPTLKRLVIRYEDKNGRQDCLVHNGNWAGDADRGEITQVHGCTEVGHGYGPLQRPDGRMQWGILHSGATLAGLIDSLRCDPGEADTVLSINGQELGFHDVEITYRWAEGCAP